MSLVYGTNTELLGTYSEMNEFGSSFVVRTRRTLNGRKLLIDITEAFHCQTSNHFHAVKLARSAARRFGAVSADFGLLASWRDSRKVSDATGRFHTVNLRRTTFVFTAAQ